LSNDEWTRRAIKSANEYVYDYLLTHPCVYCGNANVLTLTFDHVRGKNILTFRRWLVRDAL
jgi:hypothetical protein